MILISYDIKNDKLRASFAKYIKKFGYRIQYSVYEIRNSKKILDNIICEIEHNYEKKFSQSDSVIIIETSNTCKLIKMGYAKNDESDIIVVD